MKKYTKPEIEMTEILTFDIICTSVEDDPNARRLKTVVAGNEGTDYGSQAASIYD